MRVVAFIDGFNLYHAIRRLGDNRLKWCDARALMGLFLKSGDELAAVRFYTAFPWHVHGKHGGGVRRRWRAYTAALAADGVAVIEGKFKAKNVWINFDRAELAGAAIPAVLRGQKVQQRKYEEKETDVNIALDMLDLAYCGEFDKCFLVSGDSDLIPAIRILLRRFPQKRVVALAPPAQRTNEIGELAAKEFRGRLFPLSISRAHIAKCRLPDEIESAGGVRILSPMEYR